MLKLADISLSFPTFYKKNFAIAEWLCDRFYKRETQIANTYNVLNKISLEIADGESVGIIGKNGCGKSTLLKVIAGIYEPDGGIISGNDNVTSLLSLGTGFDNHLSGRENIYLNGLLIGLKKEEIDQKISEIIDFSEVGDHIDKPMKYYSNGMIARLSFAITMAIKADILLIDEIFSVGDMTFQKKSEAAMRDKFEKTSTKIIVSHSLSLIQDLCTRAIVIDNKTIGYNGNVMDGIKYYKELMKQ